MIFATLYILSDYYSLPSYVIMYTWTILQMHDITLFVSCRNIFTCSDDHKLYKII